MKSTLKDIIYFLHGRNHDVRDNGFPEIENVKDLCKFGRNFLNWYFEMAVEEYDSMGLNTFGEDCGDIYLQFFKDAQIYYGELEKYKQTILEDRKIEQDKEYKQERQDEVEGFIKNLTDEERKFIKEKLNENN